MLNPPKNYIPSTTAGKVWDLCVLKPQGRPAYASAIEGVLTHEDHVTIFTFEIHMGRGNHPATRVNIQAPATAKHKAAALEQLKTQLVEAGLAASTEPVA